MSKSPAFQFYPTDMAPDLDPLGMEERGMYLTLMRHLWPFGGPMPVEEAEALIQKPWLSTSAIFRRRFTESDAKIALEWMEDQREKAARFRELQAEKGKKGGRPRKTKPASDAVQKPTLSFGKAKGKPSKSPRGRALGEGEGIGDSDSWKKERAGEQVQAEIMIWPTFDDFWEAYERKGSRKITEAEWRKLSQRDREAVMAKVGAYVASRPEKTYRKDGERYLKHRVWEDEIPNAPAPTKPKTHEDLAAGVEAILRAKYGDEAVA